MEQEKEDFAYSLNDEEFHDYDTIMDEINDGYESGEAVSVFYGSVVKVEHAGFINISRIIEDIQEMAYEEHGEWAEDYLFDMTKEKISDLDSVIKEWFKKNVNRPTFYTVKRIGKMTLLAE